jgi:signal peptidase II
VTTANTGSTSRSGEPAGLRGKGAYLLASVGVVFLDQLTKGLVETRYALHSTREVIPGFLNFTHVRNSGVAFGLFASHGDGALGSLVLVVLGLVALVVVGLYFWRTSTGDRALLSALALILGGAVGNLIDRIGSGGVTDFIDAYVGTYHWHTFNVADSAITVGIVLMVLDLLLPRRAPASGAAADE